MNRSVAEGGCRGRMVADHDVGVEHDDRPVTCQSPARGKVQQIVQVRFLLSDLGDRHFAGCRVQPSPSRRASLHQQGVDATDIGCIDDLREAGGRKAAGGKLVESGARIVNLGFPPSFEDRFCLLVKILGS